MTKIAPIVASKRAAQLILKMWAHRYNRTADFIVVEGPKAGGHLGFSKEQLQDIDKLDYDQEIRDAGGIDVMLIGLGWDGHFCSNCPRCTPMDSYTYPMDRKTKNAANPTYPARDHLPITLSMGPKSLMRVKHLVMIVTGKEKAQILKQVLDSPISDELPATVLKLHPNFTVICDKDAASLLNMDDYKRL